MNFNDKRLNKRFGMLLEAFTENIKASIPEACQSNAATKGAYRFFSNQCVEAIKIRKGFREATIKRMKEQPKNSVFLFTSDASNIVFTSHKKLNGIGVLRNQKARGLNLHSTLVYTEDELLLGSIRQDCWGRKPEDYGKRKERSSLPIEQKESFRWLEAFNDAQESLIEDAQGIFMGDRGGDIYELFLMPRKPNMNLLIRSAHKRTSTESSKKIFVEIASLPSSGVMEVPIERSGERKKRVAKLEIRFKSVIIAPPKHKKDLPPIEKFYAISAREITEGIDETQDLISWNLLTTLPIETLKDAIYTVKTYAKRWLIERFHYTLKEGCKVEDLQLEEAERIDKAIATYTIVSCRIMYMTYLSRIAPDLSCTKIFNDVEWKALYCYANKTSITPNDPPRLKDAILFLAKIGGFLGRKHDGEPGVKVIWRGLSVLEGATAMYIILKGKDVGNA
jgi:hypothetical protein